MKKILAKDWKGNEKWESFVGITSINVSKFIDKINFNFSFCSTSNIGNDSVSTGFLDDLRYIIYHLLHCHYKKLLKMC